MDFRTARLLVACAAGMALLPLTSPAMADDVPLVTVTSGSGTGACPAGMLCLYTNTNFNGSGSAKMWVINAGVIGVRNVNLKSYGGNDATSSIYNNSPMNFKISADFDTLNDGSVNCSGIYLVSLGRSVTNSGQISSLSDVWVYPSGSSDSRRRNFNDSASCVTAWYG